ncbi:MAG TPA: amino acid adenylation domain-containing protein, partial [Thermoanaerobaculia bacterium]|nr:amino acid adenylation domain-containing protein [Thermoanaerobaculia bacterium]
MSNQADSHLAIPPAHRPSGLDREALLAVPPADRRSTLAAALGERAARLLRLTARPRPTQPLIGLGLDSVTACELQVEVEATLGVALPLDTLLAGAGTGELADHLLKALAEEEPSPPPLPPDSEPPPAESIQSLSAGQRALWLLERMAAGSAAFQIAGAARLAVATAPEALRQALRALVARHPALRTTFVERDQGLVAVIHDLKEAPRIEIDEIDASAWSAEEFRRRLSAAAFAPFDLERGPLVRLTLFTGAAPGDFLVLAVHHIVADFWSLTVLVRELAALVAGGTAGALPPLPLTPRDLVRRQEQALAGPRGAELARFWRERLTGVPLLELPTDRPRPPVQTYRGGLCRARIGGAGVEGLSRLARSRGCTPFMVLLAAFQVLLHRLAGQESFLVGAPTSGRGAPELAGLVGYLVNLIALRADLAGEPSVEELLSRTRRTALAAFAHQDLPFPRLAELLEAQRVPGRPTLVNAMLVHYQAPLPELAALHAFALGEAGARLELSGWALESVALVPPGAQVDLTLTAAEVGGELALALGYDCDLFDATTAGRWLAMLSNLLSALAAPAAPAVGTVGDLDLLGAAERQQLLVEWNNSAGAAPAAPAAARGLHELFEAQTALKPDAVAVLSGERQVSYGELDRRAERLSRRLSRLGVGPEVRVGIAATRSPEMVTAMLATLKTGGAYVPLDPAYPRERLRFMLEDSAARVVLCEMSCVSALPAGHGEVLLLDGPEPSTGDASGVPRPACHPEQLAYVIYTSGSTGTPKGVAVRHRGAVARVVWAASTYPPPQLAGVLAATSICFDLSVFEIFVPLAVGGTVILADDPLALAGLPAAAAVSLVNSVPSIVAELVRCAALPTSVRAVNLAGEALPRPLVDRLHELPWIEAVRNLYGPSEDTVYSTGQRLARGVGDRPTIGRPLPGGAAYLLDRAGLLVPAGVPGELWLAGVGLARGYIGRPDLTADRFRPDPFAGEIGGRLYRTGDLARRRPDGEIDFLGRLDHQVKIRGLRIELGEVEALLAAQPGIREAAALVQEGPGGNRDLVAFVASPDPGGPLVARLRRELADRLPPAMIPSAFFVIEALPRTPNGKLDRQVLARRVGAAAPAAATAPGAAVAPRTAAEELVARVFSEVLGVEQVGRLDNFFDLGGSSLLMIELRARLRHHVGRDLSVVELFRYPTVRSLAEHLSEETAGPAPGARQTAVLPAAAGTAAEDRGGVAIIGMAGRFPGAEDLDTFWRNLESGRESISLFTEAELLAAGEPEELIRDPSYVRARGVLEKADYFDPAFFGYSAREAEMIDPQQRLFLECAWEALEDAVYDAQRFPGAIGVYGGVAPSTYGFELLAQSRVVGTFGKLQILLANDKDFLCSRVAYKLGLRGPSVVVQTACSTSLTAVHLAATALLRGECDMALAGGVGVSFPQRVGYLYQEGGIFSRDGHCRSFDARALGAVGGQGVGIVVLKRLADALADGDAIRAVIKGSAINNDGGLRAGYTAPSLEGQARVIRAAQLAAGVEAETIGYVEAHGSATRLGDPIEVAALTEAFRASTEQRSFCALGSVKTNIGHLDAAAGIAGLIKTVLALQHRVLPPSLHFGAANPEIDFAASPFFVNTRLRPWPAGPAPRRAGVSSFGLGGGNVHVILEEAPA